MYEECKNQERAMVESNDHTCASADLGGMLPKLHNTEGYLLKAQDPGLGAETPAEMDQPYPKRATHRTPNKKHTRAKHKKGSRGPVAFPLLALPANDLVDTPTTNSAALVERSSSVYNVQAAFHRVPPWTNRLSMSEIKADTVGQGGSIVILPGREEIKR
jgi:hypothetical protein